MNKGFAHLTVCAVLLFLSGCISAFNPVSNDVKFKPKTMAVVAGLDNEQNVQMAQAMSESLRKHTRFQVMTHKQVAQKLPGYPPRIQGPWKSAYFEIEVDYTKTDMKKVRSIQQQLGVDYLYVLWTPSETVYNRKIHSLNAIGQMFDNGKEVGNGRFNATAGRTDCCLVPAPDAKDKTDAMKDASDYVAKEIGEKTGMLKQ
ncbi:MAG: hypothetical protein AABZ15_01765 [Nitrospirota bacterium]